MVRRRFGVAIVAALALGTTAANAEAAMTVRQAIASEDAKLSRSPGFIIVLHESRYKKSQYKTIAPKIAALTPLLQHAASVVASSTATSSTQVQGRSDWVRGARIEARAFGYLAQELIDVANNDTAAANRARITGQKLFHQAVTLAGRGDKLLGLPATA